MTAWKLFRLRKDGTLGPLFINRKQVITPGVPYKAEYCPTPGYKPEAGWHCCRQRFAPHLKTVLANGERRVWRKVEIKYWTTRTRPLAQGGDWYLAHEMKVLEDQ